MKDYVSTYTSIHIRILPFHLYSFIHAQSRMRTQITIKDAVNGAQKIQYIVTGRGKGAILNSSHWKQQMFHTMRA